MKSLQQAMIQLKLALVDATEKCHSDSGAGELPCNVE